MPSFVAYSQYGNMLSIPVGCPQTELDPASTLVISTLCLKLGQVMRLRFLGINVVNAFSKVNNVTKINSGMPGCYVGLFSGAFDTIRRPSGVPIVYVGQEAAGVQQTNTATYWDISQPDIYSLVLVNNTNERTYEAVVTGSMRVEETLGYYGLFDPDPGSQRTVTAGIDYDPSDLTNPLNPADPTGLTDPSSPNYDPNIVVVGTLPGTYIPPANC
jgi:hypothetical protein